MTARTPRIGLVTYGAGRDPSRYTVPVEYVQALRRAGAGVVCAPPGERATTLFEVVDGLLLVGGGDINPERYGAPSHPDTYGIDDARDVTEIELVLTALSERRPLLAICRGMQILNVALGGTLHQHLPESVGSRVMHRTPRNGEARHEVRIDPHSLVGNVITRQRVGIASFHHQAIDRLGCGVLPCAWADDEVIEAIVVEEHPEVIGVQWHPEVTADRDREQQSLFAWLAQAAARRP